MICRRRHNLGLTLLELVCVMAVLAAVMGISAPSLSRFFRGRSLHEEARRFLAVTRHARNLAISTSTPVEIMVGIDEGLYTIRTSPGYEFDEFKIQEYQLADNQSINVDAEFLDDKGEAVLIFHPDGLMDETNPEEIFLEENGGEEIVICRTESGIGYVIEEMR